MTSNLVRRTWQHKEKVVSGFTADYYVSLLVYFEEYAEVEDAIRREKQLKKSNRAWKLELIEKNNPKWDDLYEVIK